MPFAAAAEDVNGDGLGDLAVTLPGGSLPTDEVLVFPGSRTGIRPHPDAVLQAPSGTFEDAGASGAGDLNGDGFGDLLAPERSLASPFISILAVFPGSTEGVSQTPSTIIEAEQGSDEFPRSATRSGDVNGDGYGDLIVAAPRFTSGGSVVGRVYLFHGRP